MAVCHVEMETEAARARFARLHEKRPWHDGTFTDWAEEPSGDHPYHYTYGLRIWVTEVDHGFGGNFTTRENPFEEKEDARGDQT